MRKTIAVGELSEEGFAVMKIDFEMYKDKAVVVIRDDNGNTVGTYESKYAVIKDYHRLTKAQVDAALAAKSN